VSDPRADMRQAAVEVTRTKSDPEIADAFHAATVCVPRNSWLSALAVACQYQADHPADDDEPVTEEWLRAVGFVTHRQGVAIDMGLRSRGGPWLYFACCPGLVNPDWMFDDGRLLAAPDLNTRGHVRRLCEALGVPLRAGEGE
jgi:hypothetical protein